MPTPRNSKPWELAILLLLPTLGSQAQAPSAPEFSADIVGHDAGGAANGLAAKLHVSGQKTRTDSVDATDGFFITDGDAGIAFFVRPAQHVYMDAKQSTPLTQIFVPIDPRDPCRQWQTAASLAGATAADWQCARIRSTMIDNHPVVEYQVLSPGHTSSQRWIESVLGFPVRSQAADGSTLTLENIRIESQPPSLFFVPPDYRKLDPQALIERIKHSDVWAVPGS
ncbi:MAG TPA: hypothetical protein VGN99_12265 [Steroidobacteraceae bacterium]|nr:hypothetical protein [Steroidobacteraceae bacterium]